MTFLQGHLAVQTLGTVVQDAVSKGSGPVLISRDFDMIPTHLPLHVNSS